MVAFRNYVNPGPGGRFTAEWQLAALPEGETYTETKAGGVLKQWIKSVREGDIVCTRRAFLLAPWTGTPRQRRKAIAKALDAIDEAGGIYLEAETQRRTDVRGQANALLMDAYEDIATGGRAMPRGKIGRPGAEFTDQQKDAMRQIWFSRLYKTRADATAAIRSLGIKTSTARLYQLFGLPDREAANVTEVISLIPDAPNQPSRKRVAYVYFIKDGDKVKIGYSVSPTVRMASLTTHTKLQLLGVMTGGHKREKILHKKFAEHLIPGTREWFKLVPEIVKYIATHRMRRAKA